ncbi:MAG: RidA family protein [Chloroflexota bacterium]|nr:MAG: RidA family protein [Chloroflexota bacterium]
MSKQVIRTPNAPNPVGPYNQAIRAGNTLYVAGQGPIDPKTGQVVIGTIEEQATLTFENIKAILNAAGFSMNDVVKVTAYLTDLADFAKYNEIYKKYFTEPYPARATVGAQLLMHTFIEVECIAVKD